MIIYFNVIGLITFGNLWNLVFSFPSQLKKRPISGTICFQTPSSLGERIRGSLIKNYDSSEIGRIIDCWDNFLKGNKINRYINTEETAFQTANCFVDGLSVSTFYDNNRYPWVNDLESKYGDILDEIISYEAKIKGVSKDLGVDLLHLDPEGKYSGDWLGARNSEGGNYGPRLQDRSVWNEELIPEFPKTIKLLTDLNIPCCEVFFAKQAPFSGIKPHSDLNNFIITCHVPLEVPEGKCWIKVGNDVHYWKNGKICVFDTSVIHSTENESDKTRYVLLIRMWHHDLSKIEIEALKYIFGCLDHAAFGDEALEKFEMMHLFMGKDNHKGMRVNLSEKRDLGSGDTVTLKNSNHMNNSNNNGKRSDLIEEDNFKFKNKKVKTNSKSMSDSSSSGGGPKSGGLGFGKK